MLFFIIVGCESGLVIESGQRFEDSGSPSDSVGHTMPWSGGTLRLSEVLARNDDGLEDADGETSDWIELFNPGVESVRLSGWMLTDEPETRSGWVLPDGDLVGGGFLVVFASGKDTVDAEGAWHTDFKLAGDGETLRLLQPDGVEADRLVFSDQRDDVSYGWEQESSDTVLLGEGSPVRWTGEVPPDGWRELGFDDQSWRDGVLPVGFDGAELGPDTPVANGALFQATAQSSDGYGFTGVQGTDGELNNFTHTDDGDLEPWWQVDLGSVQVVVDVDVYNRVDCCPERLYNLRVDLRDSAGAVVWTSEVLNPVAADETPTDPGSWLTVSPGGVEARFVRVSKEAVGGVRSSEWLSLAEVEVFVGEPSPYAERLGTDLSGLLEGPEVWVRAAVKGATEPDALVLALEIDDVAEVWLDGESVSAGSLAPESPELFAAHTRSVDEDDLFLAATLTGRALEIGELAWFSEPTPGAPNGMGFDGFVEDLTFDPPRGFFEEPILVTIATATDGASLAYTLDGSIPSPDHGVQVAGNSVVVELDTTAVVRAVAFQDDLEASAVSTHTYLWLEDVVQQPALPPGVPAVWDGLDQAAVAADYEMDPSIVEDLAYRQDLLEGLRAIPTLSLVLDPEELFGESEGLYIHSLQRGREWERATSVELLLPDGSTGFQADAGVRIHGYGWRYHSSTLKHSLRLEFRAEYGATKLAYPLFVDSPAERFDSIVLRSQGSRGWQDFRDPEQAQYIRDAWARDTARDMGKLDGHATYVHLYLNGLYWGLYMPVERPDAGFAEEYLGGRDEDYDAINRRTTTNEAINGDLEAYNTLLALADEDLSDPVHYAAVEAMVNLDDLIDYMLIHQYTNNRDGPEEFSHNNMRGARERVEGAQFHWFLWDMEYSIWAATDDYNVDVDVAGSISHVYARLRENPDFRARYAARAREHLTGDGALTPGACLARWDARAEEIWDAVVGESARWGDAIRATPYTRDVEWMEERERLRTEYFPQRTEVLIERLTAAGLYEP